MSFTNRVGGLVMLVFIVASPSAHGQSRILFTVAAGRRTRARTQRSLISWSRNTAKQM